MNNKIEVNEEIFNTLLEEHFETIKIKNIFKDTYRCSHGENYQDTAIVISGDNYDKFREWLGEK